MMSASPWLKRLSHLFSLVLLCVALVGFPQAAWAHRPHDVVTQVALSPDYGQDQTAYTLVRGNLFKSTDGGDHWQRLVQGLDNRYPFSTLSIDTQTGRGMAVATRGSGIYLSDDGGESWQSRNQGLNTLDIGLVYMASADGNTLLAAGAEGNAYGTTDGGKTWRQILDASHVVSAFADGGKTLFAGEFAGQLLSSSDGGQTWQPLVSVEDRVSALAVSAEYDQDSTLYVGTESKGMFAVNTATKTIADLNENLVDLRIQDIKTVPGDGNQLMLSSWDRGISISTDKGKTWSEYPEGLVKDKMADDDGVTHFSEIALSNKFQTDQTAFVGGFNGLYKSTDLGHSWQELETLSTGTVISMDVSPNYGEDGTLAIATYVGKVMLSDDQGETWRLAMEGIDVPRLTGNFEIPYQDPRRFFDIAFSPNYGQDNTLFTTTLWTKFLRSTNRGQSWTLHSLDQEARGLSLLLSPNFATDNTMFIGNQKGVIFRSTDGGKRFKEIAKLSWSRGNDSPSMAISPNFAEDKTLYVVAETGVYKSTDGGQSWQSTTEGLPLGELGSLQIEISSDYGNDQTLFASSANGLFKSADAGDSWQSVAISDIAPDLSQVEGVALSPNYGEDGTLLVSLRGRGLFRSRDRAQTFTPIGDGRLAFARMLNVPCAGRPIQFSPNYAEDNTIFGFGSATTDVFRSTDGGDTWTVLTTPDVESSNQLGLAKTLKIAADLYRKRLVTLGVFGILAAVGYRFFKRIPFKTMGSRKIRLMICATGVVAAVGWVAFERLVAPQQSAENGFFICLGFAALSWILTSPWFTRKFVGEATAESLAAIRIITCITLVLMTLWMEDLPSSALLPIEIRHSMGVMDYFYGIPGFDAFTRSQFSLQLFEWLTALVLILGTIGFKTRWTVPLGAFFYLILGGILRQYTWFYHTGLLPVYLLAILSFTPCSDALSVDRWLKQRRGEPVVNPEQSSIIYGWSRYACWVVLGGSYLQAGFSKIYYSGFYWWAADNLKSKLLSTTLEPIQTNWDVSLHLVNAPDFIFAILGILGLYGELAYGLVLFSKWARLIMPAAMAGMHVGIIFLQNIVFFDLILIQLIFYDYTAIRRWITTKRGWFKFLRSAGGTKTTKPQRAFMHPIVVSVLVVAMTFIWIKHREYYPLTGLQMFSGNNTTGIIGYNKLIAHYDSGESTRILPDTIIYPPMNTRYRLTFRDCHSDQQADQTKCNKLLEALGRVHNQKAAPGSQIEMFEVQAWEWNYKENSNDEDYGFIKTSHRLKVLDAQSVSVNRDGSP